MIRMSNQSAKRNTRTLAIVGIVIVAIIVGALGYQAMMPGQQTATMTSETSMMTTQTQPPQPVTILGAGATFPAPLIQKWTVEYNALNPWVTINYNPIGSGGGIAQITAKTVDFAGSDAPLNDKQKANITSGVLLLMPETLGGVAVTYNLQTYGISNSTTLNFTSDILAGIYMGTITKWNDPAITAINPNVNLPDASITAVHRSDGSGTTYAFTDYLSTVSPEWKAAAGRATSVKWPVDTAGTGVGAKGNAGVAGTVFQTPGAVGYVDVIYAAQQHLGIGAVKNPAGNFVLPTIDNIRAAAAAATGNPDPNNLEMHIVNASGAQSYPIATYTYILVYKDMSAHPNIDKAKAEALAKFLWWIVHDGQKYAPDLIYVPLPDNIVKADEALIQSLTYQGTPVYTP